jgi:hypothetical protein
VVNGATPGSAGNGGSRAQLVGTVSFPAAAFPASSSAGSRNIQVAVNSVLSNALTVTYSAPVITAVSVNALATAPSPIPSGVTVNRAYPGQVMNVNGQYFCAVASTVVMINGVDITCVNNAACPGQGTSTAGTLDPASTSERLIVNLPVPFANTIISGTQRVTVSCAGVAGSPVTSSTFANINVVASE